MECRDFLKTPIGVLEIVADEKNILAINFTKQARLDLAERARRKNSNALTEKCVVTLKEYFFGNKKKFSLDLEFVGTDFQKKVWQTLVRVPYGSIISYGDLATMIGQPKAARAIGGAVNKNPIPIIIPCHRVLGSDGKLVGYEGGLWRKKWLLQHENSFD
ncbi:cysteine methyltransferase [Candidatus Parcubacteria bacterium]|nr:MAG: cysteine methyltransferase [Candidatus Parcubacteria bacterium]